MKQSNEMKFIVDSIQRCGYVMITKDIKSKIWLDAIELTEKKIIKMKNIFYATAMFIPGAKFYDQ